MNEIEQNYLVGLILKKIDNYDLDSLADVNVNNENYQTFINNFIEKYVTNTALLKDIYQFLNDVESDEFEKESITIEKIGLYVSVVDEIEHFTILKADLEDIIISAILYLRDYLPLGSVVKLNKSSLNLDNDKDIVVVIEQRMVQQKNTDFYYDYRAIPYPTGVFNEKMYYYFSSNDIEDVIFNGYSDLEDNGYIILLKENLIGNDVYEKLYHKSVTTSEEVK